MDVESFRSIVPRFADRSDGGRRLAKELRQYRGKPNTLVVGLPRGGVITAAAVAEELELPLDVLVIRRLETPGHPDLTMGAVGPDEVRVVAEDLVKALRMTPLAIETETHRQWVELHQEERLYRASRLPLDFSGKNVIVVDDGIGAGVMIDAALAVIRRHHAARIVIAVPVAPPLECERLRNEADEFICLEAPEPFFGIGYWYREYTPVEDRDVLRALQQNRPQVRRAAALAQVERERGGHEHVSQTR